MAYIHDSFLLQSDTARLLYEMHAKNAPIFDYHCHLSAQEILENKQFSTITELWLSDDHYKWRLMRANGVDEYYITGSAPDFEKFEKWAETVSRCYGNPLYQWTQLELKRYFDIDELLCKKNAKEIYEKCNALLGRDDFRAQALIMRSNVVALCTTDDPADPLDAHRALADDPYFFPQVLPAFRPDKALAITAPGFCDYLKKLGKAAGMEIGSLDALKIALRDRAVFFKNNGCLLSDHGFGAPVFRPCTKAEADAAFAKALRGEPLTPDDVSAFQTNLMVFLGAMYDELDFAMQLHLGAARNVNTTVYRLFGPVGGYDAIGDSLSVESILCLLDLLEQVNCLPRTVLYSLNPNDHERLSVAAGCFQKAPVAGKLQLGAAWWFNDHRDGMERQMKALANTGILANFIGMLTDSRSFVSYSRHEYFRRLLCNLFAGWIDAGELPTDFEQIGRVIEDICFNNAAAYFHLPERRDY